MENLLFDLFSEEDKKTIPSFLLPFLNGIPLRQSPSLRRILGNKVAVERLFVSTLKELVDAWIESGRQGEVDSPFERAVPAQVGKFTARNRPVIRLVDGRVRYSVCSPIPSMAENPEPAARDYAAYWFIHLLDSPMRERLSRCEECGEYFLRKRMPKRGCPIKRGMYCHKHRGKARARSMKSIRDDRSDELVRLAGKFWLKWNSQKDYKTRSKWIANRMNEELPDWAGAYFQNRDGTATGRWVTEHQTEIEADVERR